MRPEVLQARQDLAVGRASVRTQHDAGSPGIQVSSRLTDLIDAVVLKLYQAALADHSPALESSLALVPNGGFGRRDVAPFSDVDLMLLIRPGCEQQVRPFAARLTQDICDAGLTLGFSLRTPAEACSLGLRDATIFTALAESRYLGGDVTLFATFLSRYRRNAMLRAGSLIEAIEKSRREERQKFGETVYLLTPNVKRSRGGLRDLQLLRWVGFARYGESDPDRLARMGVLDDDDRRKLREAFEFLLRLRNEMHFHAHKAHDQLDRGEQVRLAALFGFTEQAGISPVEQFLRQYIEQTSEVRYRVNHFVEGARVRRTWGEYCSGLLGHRMEGDFWVTPHYISTTRRGLEKVKQDPAEVLRLMDLANRTQTRIAHETWQAIRESMRNRPPFRLSRLAVTRFLSLISQPGRLGSLLRRLHELRVLEQLVPALGHARHLMQFNDYHKYTVDEHSIRAVECAADFFRDEGVLGKAYRGIQRKWLLHLALLIHDLGKGYPEDHCEVGARIAVQTGQALGLSAPDTEVLRFLVLQHLAMSHLAQWRDIDDESVVVNFAISVGSADVLQMLYVLTCADLAAVGPSTLTDWKRGLLDRLYLRARRCLTSEAEPDDADRIAAERRQQIRDLVTEADDRTWWHAQTAELPRTLLDRFPADELFRYLSEIKQLPREQARAWARYLPDRKAVQYVIGTYEDHKPGIFHRLTGALTSKGSQILAAEIHTLADQLVLDCFYVSDMDFADQPPPDRLREVCDALVHSLHRDAPPSFRRLWGSRRGAEEHAAGRAPTQVKIDNNTSARYTILEIFTHDRVGLLYDIARSLFELGLSVHGAKIGTHLDQVVDVFYVTDASRQKIVDQPRLAAIQTALLQSIDVAEPLPSTTTA